MSEAPDLGALLRSAQAMQEQLLAAQAAAASTVHEGVSGGGKVRITVSGTGAFQAVSIDASVVDPADTELLEDLVLAALRDASSKVAAASQQATQQAMGGLDLGGLLG
jgi:DNA-binding YbaB/EbfC family protein